MKVLVAILFLFSVSAIAQTNTQTGNTINVNVGKGCCPEKPCKQKTKVVTKVVEKIVEKRVEVAVPVPYEVEKRVVETRTITKRVHKKNRISLLGGMGPTRIDQPQNNRVDLLRGPVGGAMYQRSLSESWNAGIQLQTNQTVLGSVGYDF